MQVSIIILHHVLVNLCDISFSSDGVGRTGAFITIYSQLERAKVEGVADIFQFVKQSRMDRVGLVATAVSILPRADNYPYTTCIICKYYFNTNIAIIVS